MITMFNAKMFLEEGKFETSAAAQARGGTKQTSIVFNRSQVCCAATACMCWNYSFLSRRCACAPSLGEHAQVHSCVCDCVLLFL